MTKKLPVSKPSFATPCSPPKTTKSDIARERRYRAEEALRDVQRYETIKKDKQLMSDVKAVAKEQMAALSKIK